jgi:MoxR-like ATPase
MMTESVAAPVLDVVRREGSRYVPSTRLELAVAVARAARRPLLLFGDPGSGKSTLARYVAFKHDLRYYEHVVTSRTMAQDLLWSFDSVRRLGDAQLRDGRGPTDDDYVLPGALWWAFDRASAQRLPKSHEPFGEWNGTRHDRDAVVLIDEIDKTDPDLPNSLLAPLAGRYFTVTDVTDGHRISDGAVPSLIVVTSNEERELPPAFERRCVVFRLDRHTKDELRGIVQRHLDQDGRGGQLDRIPVADLIERLEAARNSAVADRRRQPSTAEFLDAVNACIELDVTNDEDTTFDGIIRMIFEKGVTIQSGRAG